MADPSLRPSPGTAARCIRPPQWFLLHLLAIAEEVS